jgi:hypothetical protein
MSMYSSRYPTPPANEPTLETVFPPNDQESPGLLIALGGGTVAWALALVYVALVGVRSDEPRRAALANAPVADGPRIAAVVPKPAPAVAMPPMEKEVEVALNAIKPVGPAALFEGAGMKPARKQAGCSTFNTGIQFHQTPVDAFAQAKREGKLVLMVHIAGNFEDEGFT